MLSKNVLSQPPMTKRKKIIIFYLDPLQSVWGLCYILWHVETFGSADLGIDQPLLEISQGCAEPLLQQTLLILTLPGCPEAETAETEMLQEINEDRKSWAATAYAILTLWMRKAKEWHDKWAGGRMAKWVKWKEWVLGQRVGDGGKGCRVGWGLSGNIWVGGKSSQGWQIEGKEQWQIEELKKKRGYG